MRELKSEKSTVGKKPESVFNFQNDKKFLLFKFSRAIKKKALGLLFFKFIFFFSFDECLSFFGFNGLSLPLLGKCGI